MTAVDFGQIETTSEIAVPQVFIAAEGQPQRKRQTVIDVAQDCRVRSDEIVKLPGAPADFTRNGD